MVVFSMVFFLLFLNWGYSSFLIFMFYLIFVVFFSMVGENYGIMVNYDFYSSNLLVLSVFISILMLMSSTSYYVYMNNLNSFKINLFFLLCGLMYCFLFNNFMGFYLSFEFTVIPIFLMIVGWGYSVNRLQAGLYMFLYTLITSLPFFMLLLYINSFNVSLDFFFNIFLNLNNVNMWWWVLFLIVFMVKLPIFMVHLWLPKAHVEAPLVGSMVLAGVLLKLGGYGIYKSLLLYSLSGLKMKMILMSLTFIGCIWVSLSCLRQIDMKSLVAYSSIIHMGPVFLCLLIMNFTSFIGGFLMMLSHGVCSSGLFYILNITYDRLGSRSLLVMRGGLLVSPIFSFWWFFLVICNMGCPPTFNFFSEIFIIISLLGYNSSFLFLLSVMLFLSGVYCVFLYVFFNHGNSKNSFNKHFNLSVLEYIIIFIHCIPLVFFMLFVEKMS